MCPSDRREQGGGFSDREGVSCVCESVARQAPLSTEFSRQEYCSGLPFSSPGDLPNPGIKPRSLHYKQILFLWSHEGTPCMGSQKGIKMPIRKVNHRKATPSHLVKVWHGVPGASVRRSCGRKPDKTQGRDWLQGFPLEFPEHPPPQDQSLPALLCYAFHLLFCH